MTVEHGRPTTAPVLPGHEAVPVVPFGVVGLDRVLVRQGDVGDRNDAGAAVDFHGIAETVTEGIELLDVIEVQAIYL